MGLVGVIGFGELTNYRAAISNIGRLVMDLGQSYSLSVLPLFILMGLLVEKGGMAKQLYKAAYAFLGDKKGGLAMSTVVACGMFSAISGSSIATAATMSKVAMPEMRRYKYADSLATASIAAGGTLGILIPPSVILVIYGLLTEQSIGKLFMAGFLPGMLGILFYTLAVFFVVSRNPSLGPAGESTSWSDRLLALKNVWTTLALFIFVIGGIYIGLFSATEAAGMGAAGAGALLEQSSMAMTASVGAVGGGGDFNASSTTGFAQKKKKKNKKHVFDPNSNLMKHDFEAHVRNNFRRPYVCSFAGCGQAFSRIYTLKVHERSHENYSKYHEYKRDPQLYFDPNMEDHTNHHLSEFQNTLSMFDKQF